MNIQLLSSMGAQGLSVLLLLGVFVVARKADTSRFSPYWIAGWSVYVLRFVFEFSDAARPGTVLLPALMLGSAGVSAVFLLVAALSLRTRSGYGRTALVCSVVMAAGVAAGTLSRAPLVDLTIAVFTVLGFVQGYTGFVFLRIYRERGSIGALFGGIAMILWGIHKWDYPFLRPLVWFAPIGYQLGVLFQTATGVAVALMLYESAKMVSDREAARYRSLFDALTDCVYVTEYANEKPGRFLEVNDVAVDTMGYDKEEFARMTVDDLDGNRVPTERPADMEILQKGGRAVFRRVHVTKEGECIPFEVSSRRLDFDGRPALIGIARNISHREAVEAQLREALAQKELLLREIHHRVKNNLQIVSSLLTLQERSMRDPVDAASLAGIQARISSMALVHEMLYRNPAVAAVAMADYLRELVEGIVSSWAASARINLDIESGDIAYPIDRAIPVGLVVSELAMNACKHAFRNREGGRLWLSLERREGRDELVVGDDGVGTPETASSDTLGLEIVRVLVQQLRGKLARLEGRGTVWKIEIPTDPATV